MDSAIETALGNPRPLVFCCVEIVLNGGMSPETVRWLDGFGPDAAVTFSGMTFHGASATWGSLDVPEQIQDSIAASAGTVDMMLHPPSDAAALAFQTAADETSTVRIWGPGAIDRDTGLAVAAPDLAFTGVIADAVLLLDRGKSLVTISCLDAFGRLLDVGDGLPFSDSGHQSVWAGEKGLDLLPKVAEDIYWGEATPAASAAVTKAAAVTPGLGKLK